MTVGVDIGDCSIQIAVLQGKQILRVDGQDYPDWPRNTPEQRIRTLSDMVQRHRLAGKFAWGVIYGRPVLTRLAQFPAMSKEDLREAVYLEAEQLQPQDLSQMDVDYDVLENLPDGSRRVLLVAAPRQQNDVLLAMLQEAGLRCRGITVNTVALANQLLHRGPSEDRCCLLMDLGATHTSILVQDRGTLKVLRDVSFGAAQITQAVAEDLEIEFSEAETAKRAYTESTEEFMAALRRSVGPLCAEIRRTIEHVRRSAGQLGELILYLTGGGSLTPGLRHYLSEHLRVDVEYLDPFEALQPRCDLPEDPPHRASYCVAVGTAELGEQAS